MWTAGLLTALACAAAHATEVAHEGPPLMVVVEVGAGVGHEAAEVRKAIGSELRRPIIAPTGASSADAGDLLVVVVNRDRIVLSMRERSDEQVSRSIPSPADRAARLRAVAWLAGNVARDQVTPLLAQTPPPSFDQPEAAGTQSAVSTGAVAAAETANVAPQRAATEPPPVPPPSSPAVSSSELQVERKVPSTQQLEDPQWTVTAAAGPASFVQSWFGDQLAGGSTPIYISTQLELQRHRADGYFYGAALDFGPRPLHGLGLAILGGISRRWRRLTVDGSAGLGLETAVSKNEMNTVTNSSLTGSTSQTIVTSSYDSVLYARAFGTASYPVTQSWDLALRLGGHLPVTGALDGAFVAGTLGVRLKWQ